MKKLRKHRLLIFFIFYIGLLVYKNMVKLDIILAAMRD